jgi:hypothetical protein
VAADPAALAALGVLLAGILVYVALQPPSRLDFALGQEPAGVALENFYGPERNERYAFRWAKPRAALSIPVDGPAEYRVVLAMQDSPAAGSPRAVAVSINGGAPATVRLDSALREYAFVQRLGPSGWTSQNFRTLEVAIETAPLVPPSDARPLGVLLARVSVAPAVAPSPLRPDLLLPNLLLLLVLYGALRRLGAPVGVAAGGLGVALAAYAALAVGARPDALFLAYEARNQPIAFLGFLGAVVAAPLLARVPLPATAERDRSLAATRRALPAGLGIALSLFVVMRVALSLGALVAASAVLLPGPCDFERANNHWRTLPALHAAGLDFRLLGVWQRWDACWYEKIATHGYERGETSAAFFPLYPALTRAAGTLLAGNLTLGGLAVSALAYVAAVAALYRLVCRDFDAATARRAALYVTLFPTAFFFFAPFTEALFLALAVWALYAARRGRWWWAGLAGLLAGFTRTQGILLALPLAWEFARQWRRPPDPDAKVHRPHPLAALAPLAALCGLPLFAVYAKAATGLSPFAAQQSWRLSLHAPWTVVALSWQYLRARGDRIEALNLALYLLFAVLLVVGLRRLPLSYSLYAAPQLLLIGTRTNFSPLMAASRYVLVLFPAFVALALLGRSTRWHVAWLVASLVLLLLLFYTFLSGTFVA